MLDRVEIAHQIVAMLKTLDADAQVKVLADVRVRLARINKQKADK